MAGSGMGALVAALPEGIDWITGGSSGIGRALALRLARAGRRVAISARNADALQELAAEAAPLPGRLLPLPLDVTDADACREAVARIERDHGPLALAVLNAGTHRAVRAATLDPADFRALVDLNLMGTVNSLAAALAPMRARRRGQVAIVASLAGYRGLPTAAAYGMTKAGLINLAEALQPELRALGIKLQLVNPGFVRTPLTDRNPFPMPFLMQPDAAADAFFRGLASNRFEIVFPRRLAWLLGLLRRMPNRVALAATRRLVPGD
jgi:NAD(P)-dependent dehydrogenase (short-subunit alcohol dehydrogenase family)